MPHIKNTEHAPQENENAKLTIPSLLVVDDNADNLTLLSDMLECEGYDIRVASSGHQALSCVNAVIPDLILLDINMPEMSGYDVCRSLKNEPTTADITIIFISGMDLISEKVKAFKYGGADFISKPFQLAEVLARVRMQITLQNKKKQIVAANKALAEIKNQLEEKVNVRTADLERSNTKLRDSREKLRELSDYLQQVREEEKAHIAQEVHDELGATLTALNMDIHWLKNKLSDTNTGVLDKISSMADLVSTAAKASNRIVTDLRPSILDDLGLLAAIEWQAEDFSKRAGIPCLVSSNLEFLTLSKNRSTAVFRIVQESLTNIAKHADAKQVDVMLMRKGNNFFLQIADDGVGLIHDKTKRKNSHGIKGMEERARYLGGELHFESEAGEGVRIAMRMPIQLPGEYH